jgi:pSer/pThr/pTyr-binding forkhead associated (FHA) protein
LAPGATPPAGTSTRPIARPNLEGPPPTTPTPPSRFAGRYVSTPTPTTPLKTFGGAEVSRAQTQALAMTARYLTNNAAPPPPDPGPTALESDRHTERHYLVPPVGTPIKLDMSGIVVFGRDSSCNVLIASDTVSRRHAELRWKREVSRIFVRDLNSQNGTYVNTKRVDSECQLEDGDKLRLGDFFATYRRLAPGEDESLLTMKVNETVVDHDEQPRVLKGDAALFPLREVLARLAAHQESGLLDVDVNGIHGTVRLVNGISVQSAYAGLEGNAALRAIAALTKGRFRYKPDAAANPKWSTPSWWPQLVDSLMQEMSGSTGFATKPINDDDPEANAGTQPIKPVR